MTARTGASCAARRARCTVPITFVSYVPTRSANDGARALPAMWTTTSGTNCANAARALRHGRARRARPVARAPPPTPASSYSDGLGRRRHRRAPRRARRAPGATAPSSAFEAAVTRQRTRRVPPEIRIHDGAHDVADGRGPQHRAAARPRRGRQLGSQSRAATAAGKLDPHAMGLGMLDAGRAAGAAARTRSARRSRPSSTAAGFILGAGGQRASRPSSRPTSARGTRSARNGPRR